MASERVQREADNNAVQEQEDEMEDEVEAERICWICLCTDEELPSSDWLHPCRCRGSIKWVHEKCLSRWIDEQQHDNLDEPVACIHCKTEYIIILPPLGFFDKMLQKLNRACKRLCLSAFMGMLAASVYFSAVSFGALTLIQVMGYKDAVAYLKDEPYIFIILLPSVPIGLLFCSSYEWHETVELWWRRLRRYRVPRNQLNSSGMPLPGAPIDDAYIEEMDRINPPAANMHPGGFEVNNIRRISYNFCCAVFLPSISVAISSTLYSQIENKLLSVLMGGLTYWGIKGFCGIYVRRCYYLRRRGRYVANYIAENTRPHGRGGI